MYITWKLTLNLKLNQIVWISLKLNQTLVKKKMIFLQGVKPAHLDNKEGNLDPRVATYAKNLRVNVEKLLDHEFRSSDNGGNGDSFDAALEESSSIKQFNLNVGILAIRSHS